MEDTTSGDSERKKPGPVPAALDELQKDEFVKLVREGVGRCLALQELGFPHHRVLARTFESDPDFLARVQLAEKALNEKLLFNMVDAGLTEGRANPKANEMALNMKHKVRQMNDASRDARASKGSTGNDAMILSVAYKIANYFAMHVPVDRLPALMQAIPTLVAEASNGGKSLPAPPKQD